MAFADRAAQFIPQDTKTYAVDRISLALAYVGDLTLGMYWIGRESSYSTRGGSTKPTGCALRGAGSHADDATAAYHFSAARSRR